MNNENTKFKKNKKGEITEIQEGTPSVYKIDGKWYSSLTNKEVQVDESNFGEWKKMNQHRLN